MDKAEREKWRKECVARLSGFDPVWARNSIDGILIRAIDHIDALEQDAERYKVIRTALTNDESIEQKIFNQFDGFPETADELDRHCDIVIAAIAAAPEPQEKTE